MRIDGLRHSVVVRAGPGCDLEPLAPRIARVPRRRRRQGRPWIDRKPLGRSGKVTRLIVDAGLLRGVVERRRAQRLPGHELTEPRARLVHYERLKVREAKVTLDVAHTLLAPHGERHAVRRPASALRGDVHDAVARPRTVQRRPRGTLHDLDALDVLGVDVGKRTIDDDAVHDVEGILSPPR